MSYSLLVPCYNAAEYLPKFWENLRQQSLSFTEVICYDDGSSDNTAKVAKQLGAQVIRSNDNRGPSYARNMLADAANCEWLHFHDADDLLHPEYLERSALAIHEEVDVILCDADWIDEASREVLIARKYDNESFQHEALIESIQNPIGVISGLIRKRAFIRSGGFNELLRCWEDSDLFVRLAGSGARYHCLETVLAYSVRHNRGISQDEVGCAQCRVDVLEDYGELYGKPLAHVIQEQAEEAARNLVRLGERVYAKKAIALCQKWGGNPPSTNNPFLQMIKPFTSPLWLLTLQGKLRT